MTGMVKEDVRNGVRCMHCFVKIKKGTKVCPKCKGSLENKMKQKKEITNG